MTDAAESDNRGTPKLSASFPRGIHKAMISSPARFVGSYEDEQLLVTHAWPNDQTGMNIRYAQKSAASMHYFVVAFQIPEPERRAGVVIPDYTPFVDDIASCLSVYFGKQFNNNGMIESHNMHHVPNILSSLTGYHEHGPYNDLPRADLDLELNFNSCGTILRIFTEETLATKARRLAVTAAKFYARALRTYQSDPGSAFIDLMMAGEIISQHDGLADDELYDDDLKALFGRLSAAGVRDADIRLVQRRLYQVKRHFVLNLTRLLNDKFFEKTECSGKPMPIEFVRLRRDDITKRIAAAYDLRSQYVHTGIPLSEVMRPFGRDELRWGKPATGNKAFDKAVGMAPTFYGMERIIRFCLLRLMHKNIFAIHSDLD